MKIFKILVIVTILMIASVAFAQDVPTEALPPEWIGDILIWLKAVPKVGPILIEILKWVSVLGTVFTVISTALIAVLKVPEIALRIAGAEKLANNLSKIHDKLLPWFKYFSIYNQQKIAPK